SNHLARLVNAGLLSVDKQGRHRYYRYANDSVAKVIESMASLFPPSSQQVKETSNSSGLTFARTCYDHIAGRLGVQLTRALLQNKILREKDQQYQLTSLSKEWFGNLGISVDAIREQRRSFAYPCLDWSERKHHLAGALGAAMLKKLVETDWIRKVSGTRQLILTAKGEKGLSESLRLSF
ncbi:MAG TPA: helix-turn-helix domain-containing protein, partial [Chitinophagaceae bacterium]